MNGFRSRYRFLPRNQLGWLKLGIFLRQVQKEFGCLASDRLAYEGVERSILMVVYY